MARKFLYFIAFLIVLAIAAFFVLRIWSQELTEYAFVPREEFDEQAPLEENAYQDPAMWFSRPGIGISDPARWQPPTRARDRMVPKPADPKQDFAVFFIHPTSFLDSGSWNAPLDDAESQRIAKIYVRGMASPFNQASEIWAPRYRQATMGAFLADSADAEQAIEAAYDDVKQAYAFFLTSVDADTPIVLVGHSQGSLHLLRLLREEIATSDAKSRVAAAYAIGWPISVEHDLPLLGFPACATPLQAGCVLSWSSFAEPAGPKQVLDSYRLSTGFDGELRGDSAILCTNPLTGEIGGEAAKELNAGTLVPEADFSSGELVPGAVPARCDERGLLLIGDPPEMGNYVLPGNNYHVYDIPLFWQNVQYDVERRVAAWNTAP
ncbi:DUF3089 domain-containing protein [Pontixanthobacter aestiaquae]|uniref:DUF3089 domain-containing protein n=1 Tax=Pontixanthobacter aestiaquae TaxID=1509367 RepID=A0A844ZBD7_9SPHN|nr:DUF3089 domain-containing protein [Pontixanthobacter aestiaquae]MDN3645847.1 DUF3089 domain-containing protein [Pontixanthobacter aestiaquae]MXO83159.1 DUF3089 domain-containing protein [Pontixanthobacter aestiaquae]